MNIDLDHIKQQGWLIFEGVVGSHAYGLATPKSDTDIKGVYILPKEIYYSLNYIPQVNNETNDVVYYELNRFMELVSKNNPNILELLYLPDDCVLYKHPVFDTLLKHNFLSALCKNTFANYAITQIRKARGLNKKIMNPLPKERKTILDFCYVPDGQGAVPIIEWLSKQHIKQENCGLVNIPHMRDMYALYYSEDEQYRGIMSGENANDVSVSNIKKGAHPLTIMSFNIDGYSAYCREYKEYWNWVKKRNDERYNTNLSHGRQYDSKNVMHTFRLLEMAEEIGKTQTIKLRRPNREFLLGIKEGELDFDYLIDLAEKQIEKVEQAFTNTALPETPDLSLINKLLVEIRNSWYLSTH